LYGCINDVNRMRSLLISNGYLPTNITTLVDINVNYMPTRNRIIQELKKIISTPSNELVIFYSGHGSSVKDINGDEQNGFDSVIVPYDFYNNGFIVDDELLSIVKNIKCKCLLLFDSCNSGTVCDLPFSYSYVNNIFSFTRNNKVNISNPNIYMISGCKDNQYSQDVYENRQYGGAFTNAFLNQFNSYKPLITLYADICKSLPPNQQPVFSSSSLPIPSSKIFSLSKMIFT